MILYPLLIFLMFAVGACTSMKPKDAPSAPAFTYEEESVDLPRLQSYLNMDRDPADLGYEEKAFNSCEVGFGFSSSHNCRELYLVVVHFQLQCRDSNGTESSIAYSVRPIVSDQIRWSVGSAKGTTMTDDEGYGQVRWIASKSPREQKLRLTYKENFLILSAGDVRRIVTPRSWCESNY